MRPRLIPYALSLLFFAAYTTLSVSRHLRLETTGFDLGIFEQAVRGYARFGPPVADLKGPGYVLLTDHFHPILALLGPAYRVFPSPVTLLVAQAALLAGSIIPVTRLALDRLGPWGAGIGAGYGLSTGLMEAVGFDFHEICFAVPLLALTAAALVRERWRAAALWALPLILVKEDLPLTVAAVGGYLLLKRQWAWGCALVTTGLASYGVIVGLLMPRYTYASSLVLGSATHGLETKLATLVVLLAPTTFLALRSPVLLLAVPTLAWRFLADNPNYWGTGLHYGAVLMPVIAIAFIHATPRRWAVAVSLAVSLAMLPAHPGRELLQPEFWQPDNAAARAVLDRIPDAATVAASNRLAPQLTARCTVLLFPAYPATPLLPEWVAVMEPLDTTLFPADVMSAAQERLPGLGYHIVAHQHGIVLWRRVLGQINGHVPVRLVPRRPAAW